MKIDGCGCFAVRRCAGRRREEYAAGVAVRGLLFFSRERRAALAWAGRLRQGTIESYGALRGGGQTAGSIASHLEAVILWGGATVGRRGCPRGPGADLGGEVAVSLYR